MAGTSLAKPHPELPEAAEFKTMLDMADILVKSDMLPAHIKTSQSAFAIIQKGRELGIPAMYALTNIINIKGKPTANAELMAALIYRDHGDTALTYVETTNGHCTIEYRRRGGKAGRYTFSMNDAAAAKLGGENWQKYPAAMLRARCLSAVARMAFPDTIGGMYSPEELGADVEVSGDGEVSVVPVEALPNPAGRKLSNFADLREPNVEVIEDAEFEVDEMAAFEQNSPTDQTTALRGLLVTLARKINDTPTGLNQEFCIANAIPTYNPEQWTQDQRSVFYTDLKHRIEEAEAVKA